MSLKAASYETGPATRLVARDRWRGNARTHATLRTVPEETAVALTYDRTAYAVMMATPLDLEDFAVGFSLSESIVSAPSDIDDVEIITGDIGIELRMSLAPAPRRALNMRRRYLAGPTGCGLCGVESLAEVMRPLRRIESTARVSVRTVAAAMETLPTYQRLHHATSAVHAAAFWQPGTGLVALREDVGRHNALDKLIGALSRSQIRADNGIILLTSRVSIEMVQKTAAFGAPIIVAVSAPTGLAVRACEDAGITLAAIARSDGFEVFTHGERVTP
jgi:FdhD protein